MEICTVGSVRGESVGVVMVDLNGHEAGNGGYSQGRPTARQVLLYSERRPVTRLPARNNFQLASLEQRSGIFTTLAQITCFVRLIGNDQG